MFAPARLLFSTVGTSLFVPNLSGLRSAISAGTRDRSLAPLADAFEKSDWPGVAGRLAELAPGDRLAGAEVNSIADLVAGGFVAPDARIVLLHSATESGRGIARVLESYYASSHETEAVEIADLQDDDPDRFRSSGLANLVHAICRHVPDARPGTTAINATGGYKAQIGMALLVGQALGIPVYYKHERFSEIISFPPMPFAPDLALWDRVGQFLRRLESPRESIPFESLESTEDDRVTPLLTRVDAGGEARIALSAAGRIFLESVRIRFPDRFESAWPGAPS